MHKLAAMVQIGYRRRLAYRAGIPSLVLLYLIGFLMPLFFWRFIYHTSGSLVHMGFTFPQLFTYLFASALIRTFVNNDLDRRLSLKIRQGTLITDLLLPSNPVLLNAAESLGTSLYMLLWAALPVALVCAPFMDVLPPRLDSLAPAAALILLSCAMNLTLNYIVGILSVWTNRISGLMAVKGFVSLVMGGVVIPLDFLPGGLAAVARYSPFSALAYTPVMAYLGKFDLQENALVVVAHLFWLAVLLGVSRVLTRKAMHRFTAYGG